MTSFPDWLRALQVLRGDLTDLLADADLLGALRLWHRRGWAPEEAAEASAADICRLVLALRGEPEPRHPHITQALDAFTQEAAARGLEINE